MCEPQHGSNLIWTVVTGGSKLSFWRMSAVSLMQSDEFRSRVQEWVRSIEERTNYHSLDLGNGTIIEGVISVDALRSRLHDLEVPESLEGRRVLDVGAASGWNSFELERRGAEVVAIDCVAYEEFRYASSLLNSTVDYRMVDVDEISPELLGTFDIVLFLGVLYHLRHPLLALEKLCAVTREVAFVESFVTDSLMSPSGQTSMEFYEIDELGGQIDNWFGPTTACLVALCRSAGFATVQLQYSQGGRAGLICRRKWEAAWMAPFPDSLLTPIPSYFFPGRLLLFIPCHSNTIFSVSTPIALRRALRIVSCVDPSNARGAR